MTAAILAGGQSRRFGQPKAALEWFGRPLLYQRITAAQCFASEVIVIGTLPANLASPPVAVFPDQFPTVGPLSGIVTALEWSTYPWVCIMPVDTPFLTAPVYQLLWEQRVDSHVLYATTSVQVHPLISLWHCSLMGNIRELIQQQVTAVISAIKQLPHIAIDFFQWTTHCFPSPFFNLNTPADYAQLQQWLRRFNLAPVS